MNGTLSLAAKHGPSYKWLVGITCMLGTFMEVLDTSVANVALPHIQGNFAAGTDEITWVITSYLVANAIVLPITGWLANQFGRKRFYLVCLAVFTLASLASGLAPTLWFLILMRVIQGLAGGAMVPMSQAITLDAFPEEEKGYGAALYGMGAICGPIAGPLLGGWLTDNWSWPWIFYINIPAGLIAFYMAYTLIEDPPYLEKPEGRVDWQSLVFIAVGLGCLEVFLNRGDRYDWFESTFIQVFAGTAFLGLALFIWRSFTAENPLVDLRVFKLREFSSGMILIFLASFGMYGAFVCLPLFVQTLLNYTPTWAGIILAPAGVASIVAMGLAGASAGRVDVRILVGTGFAALIISMWMLTHLSLGVGISWMIIAWIFQGFGLGLVLVPLATETIIRVPPKLIGVSSGMFNLLRNEGGSVGIAICTTILTQRAQFHHARLAEWITPYNPVAQHGLVAMTAGLYPRAGMDPLTTGKLSVGLVGGEVTRQAFVMSFNDVFAFIVLVFVVAVPFVLFCKSPGKRQAGAVMVH
ncbi:DHA2 family efflux MFS transporter permease subunit [Mesoterricola sediminis]|uniref:EmrB/QacA family drug resistance transporter n=1 Tax=Mesoterricola sediminis TaxID=2927980 RepID=A0AA48KEJ3_9BACT|nr:DHA2 family efflux MFS transporter permease subunit [Mesoterricola sediminis]BDU78125.1 EmrB/QacA family drug resistance transporter [Mesoterricola sediminis]